MNPNALIASQLTEEAILKQIVEMLRLNGARVYRIAERVPRKGIKWQRLSDPGLPDLCGWFTVNSTIEWNTGNNCVPKHFFIEVKRKGGKLRPAQQVFLNQAGMDSVLAFKAESWEQVVEELERFGIKVRVR